MELRWEWVRNGVFHGFGDNGECVAQVENMIGTSGSSEGWWVYLPHQQGDQFALYPTAEEGQAAAEAALSDPSA